MDIRRRFISGGRTVHEQARSPNAHRANLATSLGVAPFSFACRLIRLAVYTCMYGTYPPLPLARKPIRPPFRRSADCIRDFRRGLACALKSDNFYPISELPVTRISLSQFHPRSRCGRIPTAPFADDPPLTPFQIHTRHNAPEASYKARGARKRFYQGDFCIPFVFRLPKAAYSMLYIRIAFAQVELCEVGISPRDHRE